MKYHSRELLVTAKVAQQWHDNFNEEVDVLMAIISKVDSEAHVQTATELMDVYHPAPVEPSRKKEKKVKHTPAGKPFEFVVFRN